jgi:hypothetical protein
MAFAGCLVVALAAAACVDETTSRDIDVDTRAGAEIVPASPETVAALGITEWHSITKGSDSIEVAGVDASGEVTISLAVRVNDQSLRIEASGAARPVFAVSADGTIVQNTFPDLIVLQRLAADHPGSAIDFREYDDGGEAPEKSPCQLARERLEECKGDFLCRVSRGIDVLIACFGATECNPQACYDGCRYKGGDAGFCVGEPKACKCHIPGGDDGDGDGGEGVGGDGGGACSWCGGAADCVTDWDCADPSMTCCNHGVSNSCEYLGCC